MSAKSTTPSFVLELALRVDSLDDRILWRKLEFGRQLYNATLNTAFGLAAQMKQTKAWRETAAMPKGSDRNARFREIRKIWRLTEYGFNEIIKEHREASGRKSEIGINEAQKLATACFRAVERWLLHLGGRPRFKSARRGLHSLEGKTNKTGLKWKADERCLDWCGRKYRALQNQCDDYIREALADPTDPAKKKRVKYVRLLHRRIEGRRRWFIQLVLEGLPPVKRIPAPKSVEMSIDPGISTMTCLSTDGFAEKFALASKCAWHWKEVRRLQRKLDRSRRAMNPQNFNDNDTVKPAAKAWKFSKRYEALSGELAEMHRRAAATRVNEHNETIGLLLSHAGTFRVESNNFKAFQKGRYGRSQGLLAPGRFIEMLQRKAESAGSRVIMMDARKLKPSQHDPLTGEDRKKELWERRHRLGSKNEYIDRDFLACLNLLYADAEKQSRDPQALRAGLDAVKPLLRNAGIVVEGKPRRELTEREFRKFLRRGCAPRSVGAVRSKSCRNASDVRSAEGKTGAGLKSPQCSKPRQFIDRVA